MQEIAPNLYKSVRKRMRTTRSVHDALMEGARASDVGPNIDHLALIEVFALWEWTEHVQLRPGVDDVTGWAWEGNGVYSARSAYAAKF